jgi:DNA-binding response OmpR family regulator
VNIACCVPDRQSFTQLQAVLARAGFACEHFLSEALLLRALRRHAFDLILVDVGGTQPDKESLLSWLNCRIDEHMPVIMLSPPVAAEQVAFSLDAGADDFIEKPYEAIVLVARIHALLRRVNRKSVRRTIALYDFVLDRGANSLQDRGLAIELTPREFTMAWLFFSTPGKYISREAISTAIWGVGSDIAGRTIEQHIYKLRKKLNLGSERGVMIRTAYTQGYRLELLD